MTPEELTERESVNQNYLKRRGWFIDRIGRVVYRDKTTCECASCYEVFNKGVHIKDKGHATYLNDVSFEMEITYRDEK